jgi:hypothetical protein
VKYLIAALALAWTLGAAAHCDTLAQAKELADMYFLEALKKKDYGLNDVAAGRAFAAVQKPASGPAHTH